MLATALLIKERKTQEYIPTWRFVGELEYHTKQGLRYGFMSYKCPTRLTDIYQDNPGFLERKLVEGRSGSKYFAYRISPGVSRSVVVDKALTAFIESLVL